ncbi:MAG: transglutaminase family protein [Deltaproteobacteria bacterium]|nr:transglutaminase family protein [Deltaproteobacteria bacterium]
MEPGSDDLALERVAFDVKREGFDLFRAACLVSRVADQTADVQSSVEVIERWADLVRPASGNVSDARVRLVHHLFIDQRLRGDVTLQDEPTALFIDRVLESRRGLPIALSLITLAVAEAAGLPAFPVALPQHFLIGLGRHESFVLVDPFAGGRLLKLEDVFAISGVSTVEGLAEAIGASTPDRVLMRLLANLHACYLRRGDRGPLVRVLSRMLIFDARNAGLWLQRAQLRMEDADFTGAADDVQQARQLPLEGDWLRVADDVARRLDALAKTPQ